MFLLFGGMESDDWLDDPILKAWTIHVKDCRLYLYLRSGKEQLAFQLCQKPRRYILGQIGTYVVKNFEQLPEIHSCENFVVYRQAETRPTSPYLINKQFIDSFFHPKHNQ